MPNLRGDFFQIGESARMKIYMTVPVSYRQHIKMNNLVNQARRLFYSLIFLVVTIVLLILLKFGHHAATYYNQNRYASFNQTHFSLSINLDVIGVSAYFDDRPQDNHTNVTVILASVLEELEGTVVGCNIDGAILVKPKVWIRRIDLTQWIQVNYHMTHVDMIVRCYDMDVNKNSLVSLLYVVNGTGFKTPVKTGVVMPEEGPAKDGVMVCATGYGYPNYLDEWLTYQRTIGVKFVHINIHASFLENVDRSSKVKELMKLGYLTILNWEEYLHSNQVFLYSQSLKYQDCIHRYLNSYKYMMVIDFDEYFIPLKDGKDINAYIQHLFSKKNTGSVELVDILYPCKLRLSDNSLKSDGNLTRIVNVTNHRNRGVKSIHLVRTVQEVGVHSAVTLLPPYKIYRYRSTKWSYCYFAHVKEKSIC